MQVFFYSLSNSFSVFERHDDKMEIVCDNLTQVHLCRQLYYA